MSPVSLRAIIIITILVVVVVLNPKITTNSTNIVKKEMKFNMENLLSFSFFII